MVKLTAQKGLFDVRRHQDQDVGRGALTRQVVVEGEELHGKPRQGSFLKRAVYNDVWISNPPSWIGSVRVWRLRMMGTSFVLFVFFLVVTALTFWIWMIVECATKEPSQGNDKIVWIVIIIFAHLIGALLYYFFRRPQRISQYGS